MARAGSLSDLRNTIMALLRAPCSLSARIHPTYALPLVFDSLLPHPVLLVDSSLSRLFSVSICLDLLYMYCSTSSSLGLLSFPFCFVFLHSLVLSFSSPFFSFPSGTVTQVSSALPCWRHKSQFPLYTTSHCLTLPGFLRPFLSLE
ncbi:hypothetical protein DL93DRAFT_1223392 [Clavulina sp. PMI_390]|nr:hypothetical protein DL93DRAFT_1223392 [Clavulina sp. PMI_390]